MATEAQINANRQNAQKSTGPRTHEGKATVSQNAVKHGLFAREAVIHGEDPAEFKLYREAFLSDLGPAGPMESMLAERIVSLSWRLQRAERLQNQAIDARTLESSGGRVAKVARSLLPGSVCQTLANSGVMEPDPSLRRIFAKDSLDAWLLDRLQLYERRIETSMFRTIAQLRQFQRRRKAEEVNAREQEPTARPRPVEEHESHLKKQSQSLPGRDNTNSYVEDDNGDRSNRGPARNKANQSQSPQAPLGLHPPEFAGAGSHNKPGNKTKSEAVKSFWRTDKKSTQIR